MARKTTRPSRSNGRPPGRRGGAGRGPAGPPKSSGRGRGTHHTGGCMLAKAVGAVILGCFAAALVGTVMGALG